MYLEMRSSSGTRRPQRSMSGFVRLLTTVVPRLAAEREVHSLQGELPPRAAPPLRALRVEPDPAHLGHRMQQFPSTLLEKPVRVGAVDERIRHHHNTFHARFAKQKFGRRDDELRVEIHAVVTRANNAVSAEALALNQPKLLPKLVRLVGVVEQRLVTIAQKAERSGLNERLVDLPLDDQDDVVTLLFQLVHNTHGLLGKPDIARVRLHLSQSEGGYHHPNCRHNHTLHFIRSTIVIYTM